MRKGVLAAAGLAFLAALSWSSLPARAMPLSAAAALKGASDGIDLAAKVHCWDECYYGRPRYYVRRYYRPYYRTYYERPRYYHYRPQYVDDGYYRSYRYYSDRYYDRPYYRSYYDDGPRYYRTEPWWTSGPYYGPRRSFFVGPFVYSY